MSLSKKIVIGLLAGVGVGLFFGQYVSFFGILGDAFIGLLQMTVLPYIMVSIMANLGRMSMEEGKKLVVVGVKVLFLLLGFGVLALILLPLALPEWTASSFFKPSIVAVEKPLDFLELYIPSNPFSAMANNVVPAVVLFSIFFGVGLSKVQEKTGLLKNLDTIGDALNHINKIVVKLTPYGVFAIATYNAGTMNFQEIQRLQAYVVLYSVAVLLLGFYWLPLLIQGYTGIKPGALFRATKGTLLTIFATGKIIVVLPQLIENVKELLASMKMDEDEQSKADVLMPLAYPFPNLGTFVIFVFVPFTAWFMGSSFTFVESQLFVGMTLLSSFVAPVTGIPFLLDMMKLPSEMFQLFVMSSVYTDRIRVVLGAIHLVALTLITIKLTFGGRKMLWSKLLRGIIIGVGLTIVALFGTRMYLKYSLGKSEQYESFVQMQLADQFKRGPIKPVENLLRDSTYSKGNNHLIQIKNRGVLRVGFHANALPFAFKNSKAELVGFDAEMAYILAKELGVDLEFYKVTKTQMRSLLKSGKLDIIMSGVVSTTEGLSDYSLSRSYMDQTLAFAVPDYNRGNFKNREAILEQGKFKMAYTKTYFENKIKRAFPNVELLRVDSPRPYFKGSTPQVDALLISAEMGSAWTVIYPDYHIAVYQPELIKIPTSYPMVKDNSWELFVNTWLEMKEDDGTIEHLFHHWIEGKGAEIVEPRWSVIKDVLGWVD
ncbi:MAG: cation:dicarboxylate symporter family transporter [Flavobacteriaceae bacterium]